ncbi:MAG: twin-arginine translocation signal domain-containing protein [Microgenomates group bacterium]
MEKVLQRIGSRIKTEFIIGKATAANLTLKINMEITRRDFLKAAGVIAGSTALAACSPQQNSNESPTAFIPERVDISKIHPDSNVFLNKELFGRIKEIREFTKDEIDPYAEAMKKAALEMGWNNDNVKVEYTGIAFQDQTGLEVPTIIAYITPIIDGVKGNKQPFMYTAFDEQNLSFVPVNQTNNDARGRFFPIFPFQQEGSDTINFGLGKLVDFENIQLTVPMFTIKNNSDGTQNITAYEPYSQEAFTVKDIKLAPEGLKKVIAELVPVSEEFKNLLDKFKGTKYSLEPDGSVKYKKEDDTVETVEGIKINADGSATVSYKSEMMADYAEQYILSNSTFISALTLNDNGFSLKDEDGVAWIFDAESLKLIPEVTKKFDLLKPSITIPLDNVFDGKLDITVANLESKGRSTRPTDEEIPFLKGELIMKTHGTISVLELNTEHNADNGNGTKRKPKEMPIQVLAVYKFDDKNRKIAGDIVVERWTTSEGLRYRYVILPANSSNANFMNSGALYGYNTNKYMPSGAFCKSTKAFQDNAFIWYINPDGYTQLVNDHGNFMTTEMYTLHDNFCKTGILNSTRTPVVFASGTKID